MKNETEISFQHGENTLSGSLHTPSARQPHSAIVMVQGSGPADRDNDVFFPPIRKFFLSLGISVLCYDKPGVGGSTGNRKTQSFQDRASEVLAAVDFLKPNHSKIGLFGHSQGGWIVFLVASQSESIDFVISNSGPAISPAEQDRFGLVHLNRNLGEPEEKIEQALNLHNLLDDAASYSKSFDSVSNLIEQNRNSSWDNYFKFDTDSWEFFKKNFNYDPIPILRITPCPSLVLLGGDDQLVPAERCAQLFEKHLSQSNSQIHIIPKASHRMKVGDSEHITPGYFELLVSWLQQQI